MTDLGFPSPHLSEYAIDLGGAQVASHAAICPSCAARVAAARRAMDEFETLVHPATSATVRQRVMTARRPPPRPHARAWWLVAGGAAAAAAVVLIVGRPGLLDRPTGAPSSVSLEAPTGIKGPARPPVSFDLFAKRGASVFQVSRGVKLQPGDAVRLVYRGDRARYLAVYGTPADGTTRTDGSRMARLYPDDRQAARVAPGDALPGAFILDAHGGQERLVAVYANDAFVAGDAPPPSLPAVTIEIEKEP
jgi:hypothetical protein